MFSKKVKFALSRDHSTERLDQHGAEKLDPIPHAVKIGVKPVDSLEDRIRSMLRDQHFRSNPDIGLDLNEDLDEEPINDPMYPFEVRYEELRALKEEQDKLQKELDVEVQRYRKERAEAAQRASEDSDQGDPGGTPPGSKAKPPRTAKSGPPAEPDPK